MIFDNVDHPPHSAVCRRRPRLPSCHCLHMEKFVKARIGSRKKYFGGLAPHHLGGNNEQNYCVQLSSIKQLRYNLCTVITLKIWGAWARFGGLCPLAPT